MIYDNLGGDGSLGQGRTAIREVDPVSGETVWFYQGTPEKPFESTINGSCYRLPNGNTLINESLGARAFEVTSDGSIVWEFFNPHRAGENGEFAARLYDVVRLGPDFPLDWLE